MSTNNTNILFQLSGVALGNYRFEQNPHSLSIVPPLQSFNRLKTIDGMDIHQRTMFDSEVRKMSWTKTTRTLYADLKTYAVRSVDESIPTSYFWDGTVKEMQGVAVEVLDVIGTPIAGDYDKWNVDLIFKPVTRFDKFYKINRDNQGVHTSTADVTFSVPDETYSVQFYDGYFNALTPSINAYNPTTKTFTIPISSLSQAERNSGSTVLALKDGWVVGKTYISGLWGTANYSLI